MLVLAAVFGLDFYLYSVIPKGFFPQQDTGRLVGSIQADQSVSFQLMQQKLAQFVGIIKRDPAVETGGRLHRRRGRPVPASCSCRCGRSTSASSAPTG